MSPNQDKFFRNFAEFTSLREKAKEPRKNKQYKRCIDIYRTQLELSKKAPEIGIVDFLIFKQIALAHERIGQYAEAIKPYETAINLCHEFRRNENLANPDDFIRDIEVMNRKVELLRKKM